MATLPLIRMGNVDSSGRMDLNDLKHVELLSSDRAKYLLRAGDILFNRTNSKDLVGKTGIWKGPIEAVAASYFIRVRIKENVVCPVYFWAFMNSQYMKRLLYATARGAIGQANINAEELRGFKIPLPPRELQLHFFQIAKQVLDHETKQSVARTRAEDAFMMLLASTSANSPHFLRETDPAIPEVLANNPPQ